MKTLDIILPIYNEESCLEETFRRLIDVRNSLHHEFEISFVFVDDGSTDNSAQMVKDKAYQDPSFKLISFSRNFGQQAAVCAGLDVSLSDYAVLIDADLQDPPELIKDMYEKSKEGYHVVYGKRLKRKKETPLKLATSFLFYRIMSAMCGVSVPKDTGDFRLMTREVVNEFKKLKEQHRFNRALTSWIGFKHAALEYNRDERFAGDTKYSYAKLIKLALDAIFSFSTKPLSFITLMGLILMIFSFASIFMDTDEILTPILLLGGIQVIAIGLVGEYVGRIFEESKGRPLYIVGEKVNLGE